MKNLQSGLFTETSKVQMYYWTKMLKVKLVTCFKTSEVNPEVITRRMKNEEIEEVSVRSSYSS